MERYKESDPFLSWFFTFLGMLLLVVSGSLLLLFDFQKQEKRAYENARISYAIVQEMRQSSEDLTKTVRLYVLTGDPKYLQAYEEILSIRNGTSARPLRYDRIYWDLAFDTKERPRPYGKAISLEQEMKEAGFSEKETELIRESWKRSETLVSMEREAIGAVRGLYNNGAGEYVIHGAPDLALARRLVSDPEYIGQKRRIMEPLATFEEEIEARLEQETELLWRRAFRCLVCALIFTIFAVVMMVVCLRKSKQALAEAVLINEDLLLNMLPASIVERFKRGEQTVVDRYGASVLFLQIDGFGDAFPARSVTEIFDRLDEMTRKFGVEKMQVLGESHVIVSGIPERKEDHEIILADFALAFQTFIQEFNTKTGNTLGVRMGMNSGTVTAGVVGRKKFVYDLWGDQVTLANALEASALNGEIRISEKVAGKLSGIFAIEDKGVIELPNLGPVTTYLLRKRIVPNKKISLSDLEDQTGRLV